MPESTLAASCFDIARDTAAELGFGRRTSVAQGLSANQQADLDQALKAGYRQVYMPPVLPGERTPHEWSWLKPWTTMIVWPTTTGVISLVQGDGLFDLTNRPFLPSMAGHNLVTALQSYLMTQIWDAGHVRLTPVPPSGETGEAFTIAADGRYRLPDDFGSLLGPIFFNAGSGPWDPITLRGEMCVVQQHQRTTSPGRPRYGAVTPIAYDLDMVVEMDPPYMRGQRFELMLAPVPDRLYTLRFRYAVLPEALPYSRAGEAYQYFPLGGAGYTELFLSSCRAAAAKLFMPERLPAAWAEFMTQLSAAVNRDRLASTAEELGPCTDPGLDPVPDYMCCRHWSDKPVTYTGA